ncbi:MAG: hypothetical protein H0W15_09035 [Gemmatimonadales bacterium]|nr:hypothetical protein [Gemmatimonadales bacterium]
MIQIIPDWSKLTMPFALVGLLACGGTPTDPDPSPGPGAALCTTPTPLALEVGQYQILDASRNVNCVSLPSGAAAREYLVVGYSGAGLESSAGTSASYALQSNQPNPTVQPSAAPSLIGREDLPASSAFTSLTPADFHRRLRLAEQAWARDPAVRFASAIEPPLAAQGVPVLGTRDSFSVCRTIQCSSFTRVGATVRVVGRHGVIYLDDDLPPGAEQFTQFDLDELGRRFDDFLFPIDTVAFGRESDVNLDQRVSILITDAVNDLTPTCTDGRIVGYFYGADLLPSVPGSNRREVFYTYSTKPATGGCPSVSRSRALASLPPVLIHEMQHMISFNRRVLIRGALDEDVWLNEGLSHIAEELGQRQVPAHECPGSATCFSQFASSNIGNAYDYLANPEANYLVSPGRAGGPLAERGAAWLFLRWVVDNFATDSVLGTNITRALVNTSALGGANVAAVTGMPFATMVGEWQLANYLENLPGFPQEGRLRYRNWNFRSTFANNSPQLFPKPYPLTPDSVTVTYQRNGTLRAGSGRHVRLVVPADATPVTLRLASSTAGSKIAAGVEPRLAIVRIK